MACVRFEAGPNIIVEAVDCTDEGSWMLIVTRKHTVDVFGGKPDQG